MSSFSAAVSSLYGWARPCATVPALAMAITVHAGGRDVFGVGMLIRGEGAQFDIVGPRADLA